MIENTERTCRAGRRAAACVSDSDRRVVLKLHPLVPRFVGREEGDEQQDLPVQAGAARRVRRGQILSGTILLHMVNAQRQRVYEEC